MRALIEITLHTNTDECDLVEDSDDNHPGDTTIDGTNVTIHGVVTRHEDDWMRSDVATDLSVSVAAVGQALKYYIPQGRYRVRPPDAKLAYHFLGAGTDESRDDWDRDDRVVRKLDI